VQDMFSDSELIEQPEGTLVLFISGPLNPVYILANHLSCMNQIG